MPVDLRQIIASSDLDDVPPEAQAELLQLVRDQLQRLVGTTLVDLMPPDAYDAFQLAYDAGDHDAAHQIVARAVPNQAAIVEQQFERLDAFIASRADTIREATVPAARRSVILNRAAQLLYRLQRARERAYEPQDELAPGRPHYATTAPGRDVQVMCDAAEAPQIVELWATSCAAPDLAPVNIPIRAPRQARQLTSGARLYSTTTVDGVAVDLVTPGTSTSRGAPGLIFLGPRGGG